ncbi:TetR/AcrR family transcriptional regulator [Dactylosporangium sp. CA-233914]|uniref:TetR/AcrR family transcriptional regulator n=1 Tax=Dactylosporangium sp. CA-233914 TaxID=3239934 RepID=UPI003D8A2A7E
MGLREMKAARTRRQIVEVALDLVLEQGYDPTTMEQIAERAEVGTSTLYRYFPSKELLVLEPFTQVLDFAQRLEQRPADEPLDAALGAVIRESYPGKAIDRERLVALRRIVDHAPGPRARLWDLVNRSTRDLERVIATRAQLPSDDLTVSLAARMVLAVYEIVGQAWSAGHTRDSWERAADRTLAAIARTRLVIPRL